jgi:drug/metabolite transporter (DMT)-like permease
MKLKYIISSGILGIIFMVISQLSFSINDSIVKLIVQESNNKNSILNVIFVRGFITTFVIYLYLTLIEKKRIKNIIININYHKRGLFEVLTAFCFLTALVLLPVAEVYTLLMTNPFFVTIFAFFFLKEKVGLKRWCAVLFGFIGVIIVINPSIYTFNYLFFLPILAAIFLTIRDVTTKDISTKSNSFEIIFITSLLITLFSGVGSLFIEFSLGSYSLIKISISSFFLTVAYLFSVLTVFYAPLSLTASARYSVIIFGIIFGYLILGEEPSYSMLVGALVISLSGLFVIKREKDLGKIE